ncbi:hypothetical protein HYU11_01735 [Candidatus Woesearchaeota archaeon]|nr:hypothetical protein [Candidatus Woesearchaeota archaeon]
MKINDSAAVFNWTPSFADSGVYVATFVAQDIVNLCANQTCSNSSSSEQVNISVLNVNRAPVLANIGNKSVNEGSSLQFVVSASDPDGDPIGFAASNLPTGATFNQATRTFLWTPGSTQSGNYFVTFSISDGTLSDSEVVFIVVNDIAINIAAETFNLGGRTQQRSNPRAEQASDENVHVSGSFSVSNTGPDQITGLNISSITPTGGFGASSLNFTLTSISTTSINPGESALFTFSARVPENLDAVDPNTLEERAFDVATINVIGRSATGVQVAKPVTARMQARNNLRIKEVRIISDVNSESLDEGDTVKNVRPGDRLRLEVTVENRFSNNDNVDLLDVDVSIENDDLDLDESDTIGDIGPRKTRSTTLNIDIPNDAERDEFEVVLRSEADDENGAGHGERFTFTIEVDREEHEISIARAELDPTSIICETAAELNTNIRNTGRNDEDDVFLRISSTDMRFNQLVGPFTLDEDEARLSTFSVPILSNLTPGSKRITVETFYDGDKLSQRKVVILQVSRCETAPVVVPLKNESVVVVQPPPREPVIAEPPKRAETLGFSESPYYIPALVIGNLILLGLAIFAIGKLLAQD